MKEAERQNLRQELQFLKECQVRYFILSITATSAIVGIVSQLGGDTNGLQGFQHFYLSPLLVLIPCSLIFFDKATTIARIVGYFRHLEKMILDEVTHDTAYIGWENALASFREAQSSIRLSERRKEFFKGFQKGIGPFLYFYTTQRYWSINWYAFFILGVVCVLIGFPGNYLDPLWIAGTVLFVISSLFTLFVAANLVAGIYSYNRNYEIWHDALSK